jgi:hypothetical protein
MVEIKGNTYPVRIQLKRLGGRWSPSAKCWMISPDKKAEAEALVARCGTKKPAPKTQNGDRITPSGIARDRENRRVCKDCGCRINYGIYCGKCEFR